MPSRGGRRPRQRGFCAHARRHGPSGASPASAEDVDRPGARPEPSQPVAHGVRGDGRAARAASSGVWPSARWAASAEECVQPEPCAAPSRWRSPGMPLERLAVEEDVDASVAVAAGDDDAAGPEGVERAGERLGVVGRLVAAPGQHARLRQVGRDDGRQRQQLVDDRLARLVVEQHGARLGDHHRVDHDRRVPLDELERVADGADRLRGPQHPDLDGVDADVVRHGPDLRDDHLRRHGVDRLDTDGALRRERRDRRHPVHAAAGERLQVGLDAGAAAGVGPGDRQHGWYGAVRIGISG